MRLLAVVVLYHPGKDLTGNINSYLPQVDRLLLWDNTPGGGKEQLPLSGVTHPERLEYRGCGRNVGIGTALNDAVAYAREHGYTHLLTLDQDSYFLPGAFPDYMAAIRSYGEEKRVIFSVNYFIKSQQAPLYPVADRVDEVSSAMTPVLFIRSACSKNWTFLWKSCLYGASTASTAGVQRVKEYGRFVSKISCCNTIWGIRRRNTACWVRRFFRTSIRRHVLITMCAMAWYFTDSILRA